MDKKRIFIAIPIQEEVKEWLLQKVSDIKITSRWVNKDNLHVTLHFFGATDSSVIPEISEKMQEILSSHNSFDLTFKEIFCKSNRRNKMIWAGFHESEEFSRLVSEINKTFTSTPEKKTIPHITLARLKKDKAPKKESQAPNNSTSGCPEELEYGRRLEDKKLPVSEVQLWESELHPEGAKYSCLNAIKL